MPTKLEAFLDKSQLQIACKDLSTEELQTSRDLILELIAERKADLNERELKRKGKRVLDDMRGLMAKAGISMDELQKVL